MCATPLLEAHHAASGRWISIGIARISILGCLTGGHRLNFIGHNIPEKRPHGTVEPDVPSSQPGWIYAITNGKKCTESLF